MTTRKVLTVGGLAIVGVLVGATAASGAPGEPGWCFGTSWVTPSDLARWWQRWQEWQFIILAGAAMLPEAELMGATGIIAETIEDARLIGGIVTGAQGLWGSATGEDPVTHQPVSDFDRIMGVVPFLPDVAEGIFFGRGHGPPAEGGRGMGPRIEPTPQERVTGSPGPRTGDTLHGIGPDPGARAPRTGDTLPGTGPDPGATAPRTGDTSPGTGPRPGATAPRTGDPPGTGPAPEGVAPTTPESDMRPITPDEADGLVDIMIDLGRRRSERTILQEDSPVSGFPTISLPPNIEEYHMGFRARFGFGPDLPEQGYRDLQNNRIVISPESDASRRFYGYDDPTPAGGATGDPSGQPGDPNAPGGGSSSGSGGSGGALLLWVIVLLAGVWLGGLLRATPALADDLNETAWDYLNCGGTVGASSWGEPHIATFDGASYSFMVAGEFIASKSSVDDFQIQIRTEPFVDSERVSVNTAVAANVNGDVVGIYLTEAAPELRVDGVVTPITSAIDLDHGGRVELRGERYAVIWPDGSEIHVDVYFGRGPYLRVSAFLPAERRGFVSGLFGDFDGVPDDDIRPRGGGAAWDPASLRFDLLYDDYADSWRIDEAESLFSYASGTGTASFQLLDYPYRYQVLADLPDDDTDRARGICRRAGVDREPFLSACIFDVAVTDDESFADSGAALEEEVAEGIAPFNLQTLDGVSFDFTSTGDFVLVESEGGQFDIQARLKAELADGGPVIVISALAFDAQGERVTVAAGTDPVVRVNGGVVHFPETGLLRLPGGAEIEHAYYYVKASWPDGSTLTIYTSDPLGLEYRLSLQPTRQGRLVGGLLGSYDGDSENDFRIRDGVVIHQPEEVTPAFEAQVNGGFADTWRVRDDERLFD